MLVLLVELLLLETVFSMGHAQRESVRGADENVYLCLKRPSFYCLIHFYKRCVSSLAQMGRSPELSRVECLSCQSQPSLFRAKESLLNMIITKYLWYDVAYIRHPRDLCGKIGSSFTRNIVFSLTCSRFKIETSFYNQYCYSPCPLPLNRYPHEVTVNP